MSSPIIGKTNGAGSSERSLTEAAIYVVAAITGFAIALGLINPEAAGQISESLSAFAYSVASVVAAYTATRGALKTAIAWQNSQYQEDGAPADDGSPAEDGAPVEDGAPAEDGAANGDSNNEDQ